MSTYDYRDPALDPDYCDGLGRLTPAVPASVICAYCGAEMARPPVMSSHPMCPTCRDQQLQGTLRPEDAA